MEAGGIFIIQATDLYDLSYVLTLVRNDIKYSLNIELLEIIIMAINHKYDSYQVNNIRKHLYQIKNLDDERWSFVKIENFYTKSSNIIKTPNVNEFLSEILNNIMILLDKGEYEQAYELADVAHAIPEIMANYNGKITKSYWKHQIEPYGRKWDCIFFKKYQKEFTKTVFPF